MSEPWFIRPESPVVRRALWIAVAWAYVALLGAVLVIGVAGLVALLVGLIVYLVDFASREFTLASAWAPARIVAWLTLPAAGALAIWTAAYGSTQQGSFRRAAVAIGVGAVSGLVMWLTGSLALPMVVLTLGCTVAIPVEHPGRWLVRIVLGAAAIPLFPAWDNRGIEIVASLVALGPVAAGLSVWFGDALWAAVVALRSRGEGDAIRAPSSLDV